MCPPLRLAAIALLYLDQEDAFWSLVAIVEVFMPRDYYTKTLLGSQVSTQSLQPFRSDIHRRYKSVFFQKVSKVKCYFYGTFHTSVPD